MTIKERNSCIHTIELLRRMALNIHGFIDVIDDQNCDKIIALLKQPEQKWISCSEKLPDDNSDVLVYAKNYNECEWYEPLIMKVGDFFPTGNEQHDNIDLNCGCKYGVCGECSKEQEKPYFTHTMIGWYEWGEWDGNGMTDDDLVISWLPIPDPSEEEPNE